MDVEKLSVDGFNLNISDAKARDMISDKYDPDNGTYVVGDTCINDDVLYICNTDIDTPEDFDSSKWDADTVGHYCSELKSNLTDKQDKAWTLIDHKTGSTPEITINVSQYTELSLFANYSDYCATATILAELCVSGRYIDLGGDSTFRIQCTSTGIKLNQFKFNSQSYVSNCTFYIFAR